MKPAEASLPSDTEVLVKRSFDAPAKLVWRAYMEPDLMRRWCSGPPGWSMPVCEMEMRVGGMYRWRPGAATRTARSLDSLARSWKSFRTRESCIPKSTIQATWAFPWGANRIS